MPGGARQLSSGGGGPAAAQVPSPRSRPGSSAPGAVTGRGRTARRVVAGREDVRTPARPVGALSASSGPPWGRPSNRSSGRPVSRRPGHPGVRTDRPLVSAVLPPRCPRAGPGVARWGGPPSRAQRVDVPRGPRAAWSPACIGPDQKGRERRWPCLARTRVDPSPGPPLGRRPGCGAAWPTRALVQGQGAGRVAGEHGPSSCSSAPQGVLGRSLA
jgi:hypothetical protein